MKRVLLLLLCLCLLAGVLVCFVACGARPIEVDLTGYCVIYGSDMKGSFKYLTDGFGAQIEALTNERVRILADTRKEESNEILVGNTNRPETAALLAEVKGEGYAFGVQNGKLVLVGTSPLFTLMAVEAFCEAYLGDDLGATLWVTATVASQLPTVTLHEDFAIVYSDRLDDEKTTTKSDENPDGYAYPVFAAKKLRTQLAKLFSAKSTALEVTSDANTLHSNEVLLGMVERDETKDMLDTLDMLEYGIAVTEQKVIVTAYNDTCLREAMSLLESVIEAGAEEAEGGKTISLPLGLRLIGEKKTDGVVDFPHPTAEEIYLQSVVDVGEGSYAFCYEGDGVTPTAYAAYRADLKAAGYDLIQENEMEGSLFSTYRNTERGVALYVTYAAVSHSQEQGVTDFRPALRIISARTEDDGNNWDVGMLSSDYSGYQKVTDSRLTSVRIHYGEGGEVYKGSCFVVQLEDGSFFVVDGGKNTTNDAVRLYRVLSDLFYQTWGRQPTEEEPITIAAWYITHSHSDHYETFTKMCETYGKNILVEAVIGNHPSDEEVFNVSGSVNLKVRNEMAALLNCTQGDNTYIKVHTGQRFWLRNMEIEVLYTHEDMLPAGIDTFNNSSTVLRTTLHHTDGNGHVEGRGTDILWLGDLQPIGSAYLRASFGEALRADVVQVAHHGSQGAELELYRLVAPEIVLWPCSVKEVSERTSRYTSNTSSWRYVVYHLYRMNSVKYHVVSDIYNTTITLTADGPVMTVGGKSGLYNAGEEEVISIGENNAYGYAVVKK